MPLACQFQHSMERGQELPVVYRAVARSRPKEEAMVEHEVT
jgi:hypothetical protein